ncbi:MAG: hypothetical protein IJ313_00840 [Clostridia bacterium]|nr:hypothetical protein [Clostridia bacterium]
MITQIIPFHPIEVSSLLSSAFAQKLSPAGDPVFSASFYAPYEAAAIAALELLSDARAGMPLDVLAIQYRLKTGASIRGKLQRKQLPQTAAFVGAALRDVAGLRAILSTREAVYRYAELILSRGGFELEDVHDYIAVPKPSGYRSLHLIGRIPVCLPEGSYAVPIEIQLRTAAMDAWACAEHRLIYKPRM